MISSKLRDYLLDELQTIRRKVDMVIEEDRTDQLKWIRNRVSNLIEILES